MKSPITGKENCIILETFDSQVVTELYKSKVGIEVARFFTNQKEFYIYCCNDSGFRFYAPTSLAGDGLFYEDLQNAFGDNYYRPWKWEHTKALSTINKTDKVLEVGCGTGYFIERLKNQGFSTIGLELNEKAVGVGTEKGLTVYNELIENFAKNNANTFDVVCSFQVLEHITDVKSYLESSILCLKKGGKLIIGVPNNNPYLYRYDKYHALNLPPHHAGLWDVATFEKLNQFFDIEKISINVEPLFDIRYQLMLYFEYKNINFASKIVKKLPNFIFTILKALFSNLFAGRNIVAIYTKK